MTKGGLQPTQAIKQQLTEDSMLNLQYKHSASAYIIPLQTTDDIIGRSVPIRGCRFQPLHHLWFSSKGQGVGGGMGVKMSLQLAVIQLSIIQRKGLFMSCYLFSTYMSKKLDPLYNRSYSASI